VYVEIKEGDDFGQADIVSCSIDSNLEIQNVFNHIEKLKRQFTVQALLNCELLTLSIDNLQQMSKEFYDCFTELFQDAQKRLEGLLK